MKLCVIGLWHQGVVAAACFADMGYDVVAADTDAKKIADLNAGKAPLFEPGLDELLKKGLGGGHLKFVADLAGAVKGRRDVLLMFDTPVDENDRSDLSGVFAAVEAMAPNLEEDTVLLVTAQVPVGTCDEIARILRERRPGLKFGITYSPENLRLGQAIERFMHPALPVIGSDDAAALDRVEQWFKPLGVKWERVNLRTGEMTKHALNAFLATSVTFANELGNLCDEVGADGQRVAQVMRLEPRVGPKAMLLPGLGFSGGTLARDVQTLRGIGDRAKLDTLMLDGLWESNRQQNRLVIRKLKKALGDVKGVPVTVLGLTYKPDTSTLRRSASLEIIADLAAAGMKVSAHDPKADRAEVAAHKEFRFCEDVYDALKGAQAAVLITGWAEYKRLDFERVKKAMARPLILDVNNMLDAERLGTLGFTYLDVGRGRRI
jgi:UDPglucose 6-dehydrogenase